MREETWEVLSGSTPVENSRKQGWVKGKVELRFSHRKTSADPHGELGRWDQSSKLSQVEQRGLGFILLSDGSLGASSLKKA